MALQLQSLLLTRRTMRKWDMVISNLVKEVNLIFLQHQGSCNTVDRRIAPSLVEEPAVMIQIIEVVNVLFRAKPFEAANFEVRPKVAVVICFTAIV